MKSVELPLLAPNGPAGPVLRCLLMGVDRKSRVGRQTDANDPLQTLTISRYSLREPAGGGSVRAAFGKSGLGGLRGHQESLQILSLQGQDRLDFGKAGYTLGLGKITHRRWQPAGVQRSAGRLGARRATRGIGQYMHDADFSYARPSERPCSGGI